MNFTAIVALLELKGLLTRDEGEKIIEFLNNKPQSTLLADAVDQVKELVKEGSSPLKATLLGQVKPAATKAAAKVATEASNAVVDNAKAEAKKVAEDVATDTVAELEASPKPATASHTVSNEPKPEVKSVTSPDTKK